MLCFNRWNMSSLPYFIRFNSSAMSNISLLFHFIQFEGKVKHPPPTHVLIIKRYKNREIRDHSQLHSFWNRVLLCHIYCFYVVSPITIREHSQSLLSTTFFLQWSIIVSVIMLGGFGGAKPPPNPQTLYTIPFDNNVKHIVAISYYTTRKQCQTHRVYLI